MKIKLVTRYSGPGGTFKPGDTAEFDADAAADLIDGGYAVRVDEPKPKAKPAAKTYETKATEPRTQTAAKAAAKPKAKRKR